MNSAFAYVYDEMLVDPRHARFLAEVELEAGRAGIEGRTLRVGMFRDSKESLKELISYGVKNLIFVGSDQVLLSHIALLPSLDLTIGFIPLQSNSYLASALRLPIGSAAVQAIAGRLIESLDLGKIGDRLFLTECVIADTDAGIEVNGAYRLCPQERGAISIRNLCAQQGELGCVSDPQDGTLEVVLQSRYEGKGILSWKKEEVSETRLFLKEGAIVSRTPVDAFVDGQKVTNTRFPFSILPKALRCITGKEGIIKRK